MIVNKKDFIRITRDLAEDIRDKKINPGRGLAFVKNEPHCTMGHLAARIGAVRISTNLLCSCYVDGDKSGVYKEIDKLVHNIIFVTDAPDTNKRSLDISNCLNALANRIEEYE